jgi:hypothetical protein
MVKDRQPNGNGISRRAFIRNAVSAGCIVAVGALGSRLKIGECEFIRPVATLRAYKAGNLRGIVVFPLAEDIGS